MQFDSREIEQFLYHEAELLDARQYKEWLELFTDDAIYWMPTGGDNLDPEKAINNRKSCSTVYNIPGLSAFSRGDTAPCTVQLSASTLLEAWRAILDARRRQCITAASVEESRSDRPLCASTIRLS